MDWAKDWIDAKYHVLTARRMMKGYSDFEEKRMLLNVIHEMAKASSSLVRAFLLKEGILSRGVDENLNRFRKGTLELLGPQIIDYIVRTLEIERALLSSPIQYAKGEKLLLLIEGTYKIITAARLQEFLSSLERALLLLSTRLRQV